MDPSRIWWNQSYLLFAIPSKESTKAQLPARKKTGDPKAAGSTYSEIPLIGSLQAMA
jgi:hypothetical protein